MLLILFLEACRSGSTLLVWDCVRIGDGSFGGAELSWVKYSDFDSLLRDMANVVIGVDETVQTPLCGIRLLVAAP